MTPEDTKSVKQLLFHFVLFLTVGLCPWPAGAGQDMVLREDANLRLGPGIEFQVIKALRKGTRVVKTEAARGWFKIYWPAEKQLGWINAGLLRPAEPGKKAATPAKKEPAPEKGPRPTPYSKILALASRENPTVPEKSSLAPRQSLLGVEDASRQLPAISIAVIDLQQVIEKSKKGREAQQSFERMTRENAGLDLTKTEQELLTPIIMEIRLLVDDYAGKNGFTHVLNKNSGALFHYDEHFDITGTIIQLYDRRVSRQP